MVWHVLSVINAKSKQYVKNLVPGPGEPVPGSTPVVGVRAS